MSHRIRITALGIYGLKGEIAIGTEFTVNSIPENWKDRCVVIGNSEDKELVTAEVKKSKERINLEAQAAKFDIKTEGLSDADLTAAIAGAGQK